VTAFVDPQRYLAYLSIMTVMCWVPGPANLFSVANGAQRGPRSALISVLGMNLGTLVWFCGAALGLGALVAAFPLVFKGLAVLGALYVAWLGVQSLWSALKSKTPGASPTQVRLGRSPLLDGFLVQVSNPKALLFFTAVLPPFIDLRRPLQPQLIAFALGLILMDGVSMTSYGLGGAALARRMQDPGFHRAFSALVGLVLIGAAALIASRA